MDIRYKIISFDTLKYTRIKAISEFRKKYNCFDEDKITYIEAKEIFDTILEISIGDGKINYLEDINYKMLSAIQMIFNNVEYETLVEEGFIMDLGSSKYQMLEAKQLEEEADEWFKTLSDREKEYVSYFQTQFIATAT